MSTVTPPSSPTTAPTGTPPLSKFELYKLEKDGFSVLENILEYSAKGDFSAASESERKLFRWFGLYPQRPNEAGFFMQRIKIPGGQIFPAQLKRISEITEKYARGFGDITTRQTIQLHWLRIDYIKPIYATLAEVNLFCQFACGDTPRNVVSCPLAGVAKDEIIDSSAHVLEVNEMYRLGGREFSNLPRKYKTSLAGCAIHCHQPQINDLAFYGVKRANGEVGYALMVGGGLSDTPYYAKPLRAFVRPDQVTQVARAVAHLFRDYGYREKRNRARLKFLVDDKGWEWTRDRIEEKLGFKLEHDDTLLHPPSEHSDHMGIGEQKDGNFYVGVPIERGRWTAKNMADIARLADRYAVGQKRIRLTAKQNVIILDVPRSNVDALTAELSSPTVHLPVVAHPLRDSLITCTGTEFCNLAVVETKHRAGRVLSWLEQNVPLAKEDQLFITFVGCPNSCAQYQIADIGMTGTPTADPVLKNEAGKPLKVDGFRILLGGRLGTDPKFGEYINKKNVVPADRIHLSIKSLIEAWLAGRQPGEKFPAWCDRTPPEQLLAIILDAAFAPGAQPLSA